KPGCSCRPKPTIFLPSPAERNLHKAGTCLCLFENFFPDVINIYWKQKNSNSLLASQQGDIRKTGDTYMTLSWLTVPEKSLHREHQCVVKHESYNGADQEILFPPMKTVLTVKQPRGGKSAKCQIQVNNVPKCPKKRNTSNMLQLQLTNNSACYTYLLLLVKSVVYSAATAFCVIRRTGVCRPGKSP
uniref:Immunoglobulin C1-set domain-containing protein n=1 Tax=Otolemur garnettii TaxID=30611 RepID=H0XYS9_OTOGA